MRSRAGDQNQEELPVRPGEVVTVHGLAGGLADGGAMHDGTPHRVLVALVLGHTLREKMKQSVWVRDRKHGAGRRVGTWKPCRPGWISLGRGRTRIFSGSESVTTFCEQEVCESLV